MSIRLRLTLLYSAILALTLLVLGIGIYVAVSQVTLGLAYDAGTTETNSVAATIRPHLDPDHLGNLSIFLPPPEVAQQDSIQVRLLDGTVIYQSNDLQASHTTLPLSDQAPSMQPGDVSHDTMSIDG